MTDYRVKGSSVLSKIDFVSERWGADTAATMRKQVEAKIGGPLMATGWVPYRIFTEVLDGIARERFGGRIDRLRELGRDSAEKALGGTYRVYARGEDFRDFLAGLSRLHGTFYDQGGMTIEDSGERACRIVLSGAPHYERSDMEVAAGFYLGAAEHFGHPLQACSIDLRRDRAEFELRW